jgi:hypothetical protein
MALLGLGLVGVTLLLLASVIVGVLVGPVQTFGYVVYLIGWMMAGTGVTVFWQFRLNATYALAIYPLGFYLFKIFWGIFKRANLMAGGNPAIDNLLTRLLLFPLVCLFTVGMWFAVGLSLMSFAVQQTHISTTLFDWLADVFTANFAIFAIFEIIIVGGTYALVLFKVIKGLNRDVPVVIGQ